MAIETILCAFLFGDWQTVHHLAMSDFCISSYTGLATVLLPIIMIMALKKYLSGITFTFLSVLEPILGGLFAFLFVHERLALRIYVGLGLALISILIEATAQVLPPQHRSKEMFRALKQHLVTQMRRNQKGFITHPHSTNKMNFPTPINTRAQVVIASLQTASEGVTLRTLQRLTNLPGDHLYHLLQKLEKRGSVTVWKREHGTRIYTIALQKKGQMRASVSAHAQLRCLL